MEFKLRYILNSLNIEITKTPKGQLLIKPMFKCSLIFAHKQLIATANSYRTHAH